VAKSMFTPAFAAVTRLEGIVVNDCCVWRLGRGQAWIRSSYCWGNGATQRRNSEARQNYPTIPLKEPICYTVVTDDSIRLDFDNPVGVDES
jgi:hypothetical protein